MLRLHQILIGGILALVLAGIFTEVSSAADERLARLVAALGDTNDRQGASIALAQAGAAAVPAVRDALASGDRDLRVWSAYTLGEIGSAAIPAREELKVALADSDPALRRVAAEALGKIGASDAIGELTDALDDRDRSVRRQSIIALGRLHPKDDATMRKMIASLSDPAVRSEVRDALVQCGPPAVVLLSKARDDDRIRYDVTLILRRLLAKVGPPTDFDLPSLRDAMHDSTRTTKVRATAATDLATLGPAGIQALVDAFEVEGMDFVQPTFSQAGPEAVPLLLRAMTNERAGVRARAVRSLGYLKPKAPAAVPDLIRLLRDEDRDVRYATVRTLHEFGAAAAPAVDELRHVILNPREVERTRQWAIKALVVTLPATRAAVVDALGEAAKEETNYGVRQLALQQLKKIGTNPD